jgi:hypothetical protein
MFFRGSRYETVSDASLIARDGRSIAYKRMRFIPKSNAPLRLAAKVEQGDRPELVAYRAFGDPEQFWRLCDLNLVQRPVDLTSVPGARIAVPAPEGGG